MATHVFRVTQDTGANGRRGNAPGYYVSVRSEDSGNMPGAWLFMAGPSETEAGAVDAAKAGLKARGITGTARLERPEDDKAATRSLTKPKKRNDWRAKLAKRGDKGLLRASEAMQAPTGYVQRRRVE